MADIRRKSLRRPKPRGDQRVVRIFVMCLALLLLFGIASGNAAAGVDVQNLPGTTSLSAIPVGPAFLSRAAS
jgi:energy-converting hydrogenase Eha subunit F